MIFGLLVEINNKHVTITSANIDFTNIKEKGIEFKLPEQVKLDTLEKGREGINNILQKFGVEKGLPESKDVEIDWLKDILGKLGNLELWVDEFHIKIPGSEEKSQNMDKDSRYTLRMRAAWPSGRNGVKIPFTPVTIKGIAFGVTNEEETPALPEQSGES